MNTRKIFISFLLGSAVGSAIALLFAPKPGKQLRNDISRKSKEFIENSKKITSDTWNETKNAVENTIDGANDVLNNSKEKILNKAAKAKDAIKAGISAYNEERKSGVDENISSTSGNVNIKNQIT